MDGSGLGSVFVKSSQLILSSILSLDFARFIYRYMVAHGNASSRLSQPLFQYLHPTSYRVKGFSDYAVAAFRKSETANGHY